MTTKTPEAHIDPTPELVDARKAHTDAIKRHKALREKINEVEAEMATKKTAFEQADAEHAEALVAYSTAVGDEQTAAKKPITAARKKAEKMRGEYADANAIFEAVKKAHDASSDEIKRKKELMDRCMRECLMAHAEPHKEQAGQQLINALEEFLLNYHMSRGRYDGLTAKNVIENMAYKADDQALNKFHKIQSETGA